jgi:chromosome segregation ATPase
MATKTISSTTWRTLEDSELLTGAETPGNLIVAGINGFFGLLWHIIQLIAQGVAGHRTRLSALEDNQTKLAAALTALQKEVGLDEAELLKLEPAPVPPAPAVAPVTAPVVDTTAANAQKANEANAANSAPTADALKAQIGTHQAAIDDHTKQIADHQAAIATSQAAIDTHTVAIQELTAKLWTQP